MDPTPFYPGLAANGQLLRGSLGKAERARIRWGRGIDAGVTIEHYGGCFKRYLLVVDKKPQIIAVNTALFDSCYRINVQICRVMAEQLHINSMQPGVWVP